MSPETDQRKPDRRARLLSHAARKYSRQLRRVGAYLAAHDRVNTPPSTSPPPKTLRGRTLGA